MRNAGLGAVVAAALAAGLVAPQGAAAGVWTLELSGAPEIAGVGVVNRWDADGNALRPVNPKARIDAPQWTAAARPDGANRWTIADLPPGRYDVVIFTKRQERIEGFTFPPVLEFDPFLASTAVPPAGALETVGKHIRQSRHYENKVTPLFFAGDAQQIRVLMQLLRDEATSFDGEFGQPVATLRHEIWQYTNQYGGWVKEKRTRVLDRVLMGKQSLGDWTWVWDPRLGGIDITAAPTTTHYEWPAQWGGQDTHGLLPQRMPR